MANPGDTEPLGRREVQEQVQELVRLAKGMSQDEIKNGEWFGNLLLKMLRSYAKEANADFFRKKYPGIPRDGVADRIIALAKKYAALAGSASGAVASAAAVAAGLGAAVTIPAALASICGEMFYVTRLQMRLVYDLSVIYGKPFDLEDPEELYEVFQIALGIKSSEGGGNVIGKAVPEVSRRVLQKTLTGRGVQKTAIKYLGRKIGQHITQRAVIKVAVPVIAVATSTAWNYYLTGVIADGARALVRHSAAVHDLLRPYASQVQEGGAVLLLGVWAMISCDRKVVREEQALFDELCKLVGRDDPAIREVASYTTVSPEVFLQRFHHLRGPGIRKAIYECLRIAAIVDGVLAPPELDFLRNVADLTGQPFDAAELVKQAKQLRA